MILWRRSLYAMSVGLVAMGLSALPAPRAEAAEWLAPAPQAHIDAPWVQDVAKALRANKYKNVFMNQPFGCDQCRILEYLTDAAEALDGDEPKLAKSFVRRALSVLDDGVKEGWYDEADVRPIKRLIITKAKKGFEEAGGPSLAMSVPDKQGKDKRYAQGDEPMFSRNDEQGDAYGSRRDRWSGYTSHRRLGLSNEPPDRDGGTERSSRSQDPYSGQYLDEVGKMSRSQQASRSGNPFSGSYGDLVERWTKQSREEFRQANQPQGAPESEQSRFNTAQQLEESGKEQKQ